MLKGPVIIVIPVYKPFSALTPSEKASLSQCFSVLGARTICCIAPENLVMDEYIRFAKAKGIDLHIEKFKNSYFGSIAGYNKLLLSIAFYERFSLWKFILIYQVDAWVFSDQLDFWMGQPYDFIGAPLFEGFHKKGSIHFIKGLNGGFSIRSVQASIRLAERIKKLRRLYRGVTYSSLFTIRTLKPIIRLFRLTEKYHIKSFEKLQVAIVASKLNEDYYWTKFLEEAFTDYKVPDPLVALRFCFELNSAYLYTLHNNQLPFGCHAWEKYEPEFWQKFIKV